MNEETRSVQSAITIRAAPRKHQQRCQGLSIGQQWPVHSVNSYVDDSTVHAPHRCLS